MTLSKNIRYLRKKRNWSQEDLAAKLGKKSFTTIQKWESGVSDPTFKTLLDLAQVFGVDVDALANSDLELDGSGNGLSISEAAVLSDYRQLNLEGQEKVQAYLSDLLLSGAYKKHDPRGMVDQA